MFFVASVGWRLWERNELTHFFLRDPYRSARIAVSIFALGWFGVVVSAPTLALTGAHLAWEGFLGVLWAPFLLGAWSVWELAKLDRGPGTALEWGRKMLVSAEQAFASESGNRDVALREARYRFALSRKYLAIKNFGSEDWARAVHGEVQAVKELAESSAFTQDHAANIYNAFVDPAKIYKQAIEDLGRAGLDASVVRVLLEGHRQSTA
jgi:hypothetical protein